jgi:hypothetical protein
MIVCDYCGEQVTDGPVPATVPVDPTAPMQPSLLSLDLHRECAKAWAKEAKKIKGQKPA